jgi:hypothetical protein
MRLFELAYCCAAYAHLEAFDEATVALRDATGSCVDPGAPDHHEALFIWLRRWGCRQFKIADEEIARASLSSWWQNWGEQIPAPDLTLDQADDELLDVIAAAFEDLRQRQASWQDRQDVGPVSRGFGPAGASKALYAIRPNCCSPWDDPIRRAEGLPKTGAGYRQHLLNSREALAEAVADLGPGGAATDLPALLDRSDSSPVKLIDEHDWARYSRGFEPPAPAVLARWADWAQLP